MSENPRPSSYEADGNEEFYEVLSELISRRDAGEDVDINEYCEQHPEHAKSLRSFAGGDGLFEAMLESDASGGGFAPPVPVTEVDDESSDSIDDSIVETVAQNLARGRESSVADQFGRYRIIRELGEGAMGTIYLVEDTNLEREVALKIPKFKGKNEADFIQRFSREAKAAARLDHPYICRVYDAGKHDGTPYITMAFIDGQPLQNLVGTPEFDDQRRVVELVRDIADGLAHAHEQNIMHRDLKPGNILIQADGTPCITDFGLARRADSEEEESRITLEGVIIGTPAYMSPEQIEGRQNEIGPTTDIYSLGVIFFELLTRQLPFRGSVMSILGKTLRDQPPALSELRADVNPRLEQLCLKMLEKAPADRPQSMPDIVEELTKWLEVTPDDHRAAEERAKRRKERLEASRSKIKELIQFGQYKSAVRMLEKLALVKHPQAEKYVSWAKKKLAELKVQPEFLTQNLHALVAAAKKHLARKDYQQAVILLSQVSLEDRNDEVNRLFAEAIKLRDVADTRGEKSDNAWIYNVLGVGALLVIFAVVMWAIVNSFGDGSRKPSNPLNITGGGNTNGSDNQTDPSLPANTTENNLPNPFPSDAKFAFARPISELNNPVGQSVEKNSHPWISADGLTLWWSREGKNYAVNGIYQASRSSVGDKFSQIFCAIPGARIASISPDGWEAICLYDSNNDGDARELCVARRAAKNDAFSKPLFVNAFLSMDNPKGTAFSSDGLQLLILNSSRQRSPQTNDIYLSKRKSLSSGWSRPEKVTYLQPKEIEFTGWPSFVDNGDHIMITGTVPGFAADERPYLTTFNKTSRLLNETRKILIDGKHFKMRSPRYCAKTGELFYTQLVGQPPYYWQELWIATPDRPSN